MHSGEFPACQVYCSRERQQAVVSGAESVMGILGSTAWLNRSKAAVNCSWDDACVCVCVCPREQTPGHTHTSMHVHTHPLPVTADPGQTPRSPVMSVGPVEVTVEAPRTV
jgi:hypothetical protein